MTAPIEWRNVRVYIFFGFFRRCVQIQRQGSRKVADERNRDLSLEDHENLALGSPVAKSGSFDSP